MAPATPQPRGCPPPRSRAEHTPVPNTGEHYRCRRREKRALHCHHRLLSDRPRGPCQPRGRGQTRRSVHTLVARAEGPRVRFGKAQSQGREKPAGWSRGSSPPAAQSPRSLSGCRPWAQTWGPAPTPTKAERSWLCVSGRKTIFRLNSMPFSEKSGILFRWSIR